MKLQLRKHLADFSAILSASNGPILPDGRLIFPAKKFDLVLQYMHTYLLEPLLLGFRVNQLVPAKINMDHNHLKDNRDQFRLI